MTRAGRQQGMVAVAPEGLDTGDETALPPITSAFEPADPCIYSLPDSGEEVENPKHTLRWTVNLPQEP